MARRLPDIAEHGRHLCKRGRATLGAMAAQHQVREPAAFWLSPGQWDVLFYYLKGGGFDVARGFVFHGVPVKKFNA